MIIVAWAVGFLNSLPNTLLTYSLHFCGPSVIPHFCCDLPSLFPLSCSDPTANEALAGSCALFRFVTLPLILFSYSRIISSILVIHSSGAQGKAFSTCSSHLTVVLLYYATALFRYITLLSGSKLEQVVSVPYNVITSLLNSLIYSLKNPEGESSST